MDNPMATPIYVNVERLERVMTQGELREQLERGHERAFGWALACCRGVKEEAEDVLHDSYLAVLNGQAQFDARSNFQTWLFGVIRLKALSARRKAWWRNILLERRNGSHPPEHVAPLDAALAEQAEIERMRSALESLAQRQREVLHLVFYQEMTIEEAALVMGVSIGTARTHYARGKDRLARILREAD